MRVFISYPDGGFYKAKTPYTPNDMEKPCVTVEMLEVLTKEPQQMVDIDEKIRLLRELRKNPQPAVSYTEIPDLNV